MIINHTTELHTLIRVKDSESHPLKWGVEIRNKEPLTKEMIDSIAVAIYFNAKFLVEEGQRYQSYALSEFFRKLMDNQ